TSSNSSSPRYTTTRARTHLRLSRQAANRRDEVKRAGQRRGEERESVAHAVRHPRHALEHGDEPALLGAEADEHRAMVRDRAVGHVAAEDLAEHVLVGPRDVRIGGLVLALGAVAL